MTIGTTTARSLVKNTQSTLAQPAPQALALMAGDPTEHLASIKGSIQPAMKSYGQFLEMNERHREELKQEMGLSRSSGENTVDAHLSDIALTSSLWAKNVKSMSWGFINMVGDLINDPKSKEKAGQIIESSMEGLKASQPEVWEFTKGVVDNFAANLGLPNNLDNADWLTVAGAAFTVLTAPVRLVGDIGHLMATKTVQYAQHPEQMAQDFMTALENGKKTLDFALQVGGSMLGTASKIGGVAANLVKSLFDDYGFDKAWEGLGKIGQGIANLDVRLAGEGIVDILGGALEFGLEFSGAADLKRAYDSFREGDFIGFAMNAAFGITGLVGTVATFGAANAMLAGAKSALKRGTQELVEKGTKELVKGVGDDVLEAVSGQLDDVLSESLGKTFTELQKEYGTKIANEAKDDILKLLRSDEVVRHGLPENILEVLKNTDKLEDVGETILKQLDDVVEKQVQNRTEQYSKELLKHSQAAIEEQTKEFVGRHFDNLLNLSDDELVKQFSSILENADETLKHSLMEASERASLLPKGITKFMGNADERCAKAYANRIRIALQGGKFDKQITDAYTEEITQKLTASMRSGFSEQWGKNVDEMLETLEVNNALRHGPDGLAARWKEAGERGFDKGLKPIRDVVRKKVAEEIASRRRMRLPGNQAALAETEVGQAFTTPGDYEGALYKYNEAHHTMWMADEKVDPNEALRRENRRNSKDVKGPDATFQINEPVAKAEAPEQENRFSGTVEQLKHSVRQEQRGQESANLPEFLNS